MKPNNFSLAERSIMRLKFRMTPKQLVQLKHKLKRTNSPNRNKVLLAENITAPEEVSLSSPRYHARPVTSKAGLSNDARSIRTLSKNQYNRIQSSHGNSRVGNRS